MSLSPRTARSARRSHRASCPLDDSPLPGARLCRWAVVRLAAPGEAGSGVRGGQLLTTELGGWFMLTSKDGADYEDRVLDAAGYLAVRGGQVIHL